MPSSTNTFIVYARDDKAVKERLLKHLYVFRKAPYNMEIWHDEFIEAGEEWERRIRERLEKTDIFIMLISVDFLNSQFINDVEFKAAVARHQEGKSIILPVIIKPCLWDEDFHIGEVKFNFRQLQVLPKEGKPLSDWQSEDHGLHNIAESIRIILTRRLESEEAKAAQTEKEQKSKREKEIQKKAKEQQEMQALIAQEKEEDAAWTITKERNTIASYTQYIKTYPKGKYRKNAEVAIQGLKVAEEENKIHASQQLELEAWNRAKRANTIWSYQTYLTQFPEGTYHVTATDLIEKLRPKPSRPIFNPVVGPLKSGPGTGELSKRTKPGSSVRAAKANIPTYNYLTDFVWWLMLLLVMAISIGALILGKYLVVQLMFATGLGLPVFYIVPNIVLLIAGICWGFAYARYGALEHDSGVGALDGLIEPYRMMFDGEFTAGIFSAPIINVLAISILIALVGYLLHALGLNASFVFPIIFIIINLVAIWSFWDLS